MAHIAMRIEEIEYRPADKSLLVLGVDAFQTIVTLEIRPVYLRQLAADLDFVASHPNARVLLDGTGGAGRNEPPGGAVAGTDAGSAGDGGDAT